MSTIEGVTKDRTDVALDLSLRKWSSVVTASLIAGVVMGVPMHFVMEVMPAVGGLYGYETVAVGWLGHLFHSAVFGVIFAGVASFGPLREYAVEPPTNLGFGAAYGVAVWVFGAVLAMPLWLQSAGAEYAPPFPNFDPMSLAGHIAFGVVLAALYPVVYRISEELDAESDGRKPTWIAAVGAGVVAGVVMGIMLQFVMDLMPVIAALYGYESVAAGWVAHLFHSLVFAVVFAGVASLPVLKRRISRFPTSVLLGIVFGVAVWVFGGVVAMPLWLASIGMDAPTVPNVVPMSLLAHIAYGGVLGVVYPLASGVLTRKKKK